MAEPTPTEKVQPCLLDRLTDDDPRNTLEGRGDRVISLSRYRDAVRRDIGWLLNTRKPREVEELEDYPEVAGSVLNFGFPDLCGISLAGEAAARQRDLRKIEMDLKRVIRRYEPRLMPDKLVVNVRQGVEGAPRGASPTALSFEIRGVLWANPVPEPLQIYTTLDLETGDAKVGIS